VLSTAGAEPSLGAVLARDASAWRVFVAYYDGRLRAVVQHATETTHPLTDAEIDDVLGDFWLALVANDMRRLRAFNPERGSALLTWLTFLVAQVACEHIRRISDGPVFVPLQEARNVAAPVARMSIDDAIRAVVRDAVTDQLRHSIKPAERSAPNASVSPEYLSADEAGRVAGVRAATIREWIGQTKLPGHRAGRLLRVRRDELQRFLAGESRSAVGAGDVEARRRKALARLSAGDTADHGKRG